MSVPHLDGILHGAEGLLFERGGSAIPKLREAPGSVDDGGGAPPTFLPTNTSRYRRAVGERIFWIVAGGAGHRSVSRESFVEVE